MTLIKDHLFKILNGMSIGVVIALMPDAVFGQIAKLLELNYISPYLSLANSLMGVSIGACIAYNYKLDIISGASLIASTFMAGGVLKGINEEGMFLIKGTGDIINMAIGAIIALIIITYIGPKLKAYKLILLPAITVFVTSLICYYTAAPIGLISQAIGTSIQYFMQLQPYIMAVLIAVSFGIIIVSPISSVAIALLISITGNASGIATLGIATMAITLATLSYKQNGLGTSIAIILGSPKLLMANFIKNPKMIIPGALASAITSTLGVYLNIQGTSLSAGFGTCGLIGPITHLSIVGYNLNNIVTTIMAFAVAPFIVALILNYLFKYKLKLVTNLDYKVNL
ncbi:PTS sugar transporter subunit IIC [Mycoplasma sp. P36-A1]|uniref:PTS sugar transporter subunit IIC n=1 Tax=Mycoplasma sp. P36-A1 TaxID=3252900 RepID=UPI003C2FB811